MTAMSSLEAELDAKIPLAAVLNAVEEFLDSAEWKLEYGDRVLEIPRTPKPIVKTRSFVKAHAADVFIGDHFEATVALGPRIIGNNVIATAGTLRLYFNLQGKFVSEDRYGPPE
jgi:hypothetical protein